MKKSIVILITLIFCLNAICQVPVMTLTTAKAIGSEFTFDLGANAANTSVQVDFGDGKLVNKIVGTTSTQMSGTIVGSQTIKVYSNGITILDFFFEPNLTTLDVTQITTLEVLHCPESQLKVLDVSKNTALEYLDCGDNQLTKLDVSKNIALETLICVGNQLASLDITKNAALRKLYCGSNQLKVLDVTKNPLLIILYCQSNQLTTLDISKNTAIFDLACSSNQLTTLDVTKHTSLEYFCCDSNKLNTVDVSKNKALVEFDCSSNQLTSLDVSKNTALYYLDCDSNKLTALDVSKNTALTSLDCQSNQLTFLSLPNKNTSWETFEYSPQQPISIVKSRRVGGELDLSSQNLINGSATVYTWKTKAGAALVQGTDYTIKDGKTVFLKAPTESVYCEMTNANFPDLTLSTTNTTITLTTAVANLDASNIEIYSSNSTLYINTPYNAQASIYEPNGRLVLSKELTSGSNSIQVQNAGIYLVSILGNNGGVTKKVFVN